MDVLPGTPGRDDPDTPPKCIHIRIKYSAIAERSLEKYVFQALTFFPEINYEQIKMKANLLSD